MDPVKEICLELYEIGVIKFGKFVLKSGVVSPFYIDLRILIGHPRLLRRISECLYQNLILDKINFDILCGVPYTALPFATAISLEHNIPMIFKRNEVKKYGTKKLIEGIYSKNQKCLIIEDVITTGISILETAQALIVSGLDVSEAVLIIDREGSGMKNLAEKGIKAYSLLKMSQIVDILLESKKISPETFLTYKKTINQVLLPSKIERISFKEREILATNPVSIKLMQIMQKKNSNLIFSADLKDPSRIIEMVDLVGPHVCCVKTHIDIIEGFRPEFVERLRALAEKHSFLIMEDRKFADIGFILKSQYEGGIYRIVEWADIVTIHALIGKWAIEALKQASVGRQRACIVVAEMSGHDNNLTAEYTQSALEMSETHKDFVIGLVCQRRLSQDPSLLHFTPGIKLIEQGDGDGKSSRQDDLGQGYNSPGEAILSRGSDIIIVGRDIYESRDPLGSAIKLKEMAWTAYTQSLSSSL